MPTYYIACLSFNPGTIRRRFVAVAKTIDADYAGTLAEELAASTRQTHTVSRATRHGRMLFGVAEPGKPFSISGTPRTIPTKQTAKGNTRMATAPYIVLPYDKQGKIVKAQRKDYQQAGRAEKYAETLSADNSISVVELFSGNTRKTNLIGKFRKGKPVAAPRTTTGRGRGRSMAAATATNAVTIPVEKAKPLSRAEAKAMQKKEEAAAKKPGRGRGAKPAADKPKPARAKAEKKETPQGDPSKPWVVDDPATSGWQKVRSQVSNAVICATYQSKRDMSEDEWTATTDLLAHAAVMLNAIEEVMAASPNAATKKILQPVLKQLPELDRIKL